MTTTYSFEGVRASINDDGWDGAFDLVHGNSDGDKVKTASVFSATMNAVRDDERGGGGCNMRVRWQQLH